MDQQLQHHEEAVEVFIPQIGTMNQLQRIDTPRDVEDNHSRNNIKSSESKRGVDQLQIKNVVISNSRGTSRQPELKMNESLKFDDMSPLRGQKQSLLKQISNITNENSSSKVFLNEGAQVSKQPSQKEKQNKISRDYKLGEIALAEEYFKKVAYRKLVNDAYEEYTIFQSNTQIKKYGLGVFFFLEFIKMLFFYYLFATICSSLAMYNNYTATGLSGYPNSFSLNLASTSLGNNNWQTANQVYLQTITDGINAIFFIVFIIYWKYFTNATIKDKYHLKEQLDPQEYILVFSGMTRIEVDCPKIQQYFSQSYKIYETTVVYDYHKSFEAFMAIEQLQRQIMAQKLRIKQTGCDTIDLFNLEKQKRVRQLQIYSHSYHRIPLYLIVHFQTLLDKRKLQSEYKKVHQVNSFEQYANKCLTCPKPLSSKFKYNNQDWMLQTIKLGKPEDIIWENVDVNPLNSYLRAVVAIFLIIICLIITSSLIALSTLYIATNSNCNTYASITYQQALTTDQQTLFCYCQQSIYQGLSNSTIASLCQSINTKLIYTNALQASAALVSTLTNFILSFLISKIVGFMKPKSKSNMNAWLFMFNFVALFLNSIILPLLLNASIFGQKPVFFISFLTFLNFNNLNLYSDFDRNWYVYVAPYYINFFIINIFMPVLDLIKVHLIYIYRQNNLKNPSKPMLQKQMNLEISSFQFELPIKASTLCVNLFLAFLYSSNIPLLFLLMLFCLISNYICYKRIILKYSVRIPSDHSLNKLIARILPYILLLHMMFSLWSLTCPTILPTSLFNNISFKVTLFMSGLDRIFLISFQFILLLVVLAYVIVQLSLLKCIEWVFRGCCTSANLQTDQQIEYSIRSKQQNMVASYKMEMNPVYKGVHHVIQSMMSYDMGAELMNIANNSLTELKQDLEFT